VVILTMPTSTLWLPWQKFLRGLRFEVEVERDRCMRESGDQGQLVSSY
jgi:hypothetical protein